MFRVEHLVLVFLLLGTLVSIQPSRAAPVANDPFQRTWQRTDKPVADGAVSRTWMWGPEPFTDAKTEAYAESPDGTRTVQYFDKSRMEITQPGGDQSSPWYVTNGLLVVELMSGRMQVGDNLFEERLPAAVNVAGDPDDPLTYAVLAGLREHASLATGTTIIHRIDANGQVTDDPSLGNYGVTAVTHVPETNHTVASPFWDFMTASGIVYENGGMTTAPLFASAYYATGLPITEAYWADVKVDGQQREVLLQCFERRCLTYTPGNDPAWQVEAGNVGQHYYRWRYPDANPGPSPLANDLARKVTQATSDDARYEALLDVMAALHVGVYTGSGQMIVGGAERGAADFYLYDVEVRMMAGAIGRGQTFGAVDLAMQLTAMGLLPEGQTLDPNVFRSAVLTIVEQAAKAPNEFTSLSPLLVRQLGLSQSAPFDLFDDVSLDTMRFDPLSYFLLLAHASIPLIEEHLPLENGASSELVAQSNGVLKAVVVDPCKPGGFLGEAFKHSYGWLKNAADLMSLIPQGVAKASGVVDAIHGAILAYSIGVTELDQRLETHYGPGGHENQAGQAITFRIKVEMRDALPQTLIDCGWILGTDFPAKGPIEGVSVHWFWDNLEDHGEVNCGNACATGGGSGLSIDATGPDGIARMTFQPKNEENPDEGWIVEEHGTVTGVALYQSKFTNLLGSYAQYLTPKSGATRWVVKWHEVPGWDVEMKLTYSVKTQIGSDGWHRWGNGSMTFTAHIDSQRFEEQQTGWLVSVAGSGSGTYGYTTNPPVSCSWSGAWQRPQHAVEILDRDQLLVDFIGGLGPVPAPGVSGTTHPFDGDCGIAADIGLIPSHFPPAFSLKTEETQVFDVAPQGMELDTGTITWEITVTPTTQP